MAKNKIEKAKDEINKLKEKGITARVKNLPRFTEEEKKRIKKAREQLKDL